MKYTIEYNHYSEWAHTAILLTGCRILEKKGIIDFRFHNKTHDRSWHSPDAHGGELIINGKPVYFECGDGYINRNELAELAEHYDIIFQRSYSQEDNIKYFGEKASRFHPLGFNWLVYDNPMDAFLYISGKKNVVYNTLKRCWYVSQAPHQLLRSFEQPADELSSEAKPKICFMTRLWPYAQTPQERDQINSMRIALVKAIRDEYPDSSYAYLTDNETAREMCPELIAPSKITKQKNYLQMMKGCDICIGSIGLFQSTSWKTAEYVAASRAIVQEKMHFEVPGNFQNGFNYLEFSNVDECMKNIERLVNDRELLYQMKKANEQYYKEYAAPDVQLLNAIQKVVSNEV